MFTFNFNGTSEELSLNGWHSVALIVMTVICRRFLNEEPPLTVSGIASNYNIPVRIVTRVVEKLHLAGLLYSVKLKEGVFGESPSIEVADFTVADFLRRFDAQGEADIIPDFRIIYGSLLERILPLRERCYSNYASIKMSELPVPTPDTIRETLLRNARNNSKKSIKKV